MQLLITLNEDFDVVCFVGEVVGWQDVSLISESEKQSVLDTLTRFQPKEDGLYSRLNLLRIRKLRSLNSGVDVTTLVKISNGEPVKRGRRSPGWAYVYPYTG